MKMTKKKMKKINKDNKLILTISSIIAFILSVLFIGLSFFIGEVKWTWCFSIILGHLVSIGCFFKRNAIITKVLDDELSNARFLLILNNVLGTICYLIILVINHLVPGLNILVCGLGILLIKFTTFFVGTFSKSEVR